MNGLFGNYDSQRRSVFRGIIQSFVLSFPLSEVFVMRRRDFVFAAPVLAVVGCKTMDTGGGLSAAQDLVKAASLSDAEVAGYAEQFIAFEDKRAQVLGPSNKYSSRLVKLTSGFQSFDGLKLDFKAYDSKEVNAFACANGSIRIYSGLMDAMTDDEIRYVIGHEIGHVKLGHTKARMQTALATSAAQKGAAASGNAAVAKLADSQLGELVIKVIRAQHSQSNENAADDYAVQQFLTKTGSNKKGAVTALEKLAALSGGGGGGWTSTHPAPKERAERMRKIVA
ncbi:MAG: M48 family metalloprotease [Rhodocyclaceae bacterium]